MTRSTELSFDSRALVRSVVLVCVTVEILLVLLDYHMNFGRLTEIGAIRRLFNIAREDGLASWFGTTQTVMVAITLWLIFVVVRNQEGPKWRPAGWLALAIFFSYLALDDGAEIHERLGTTFRVLQENASSGGELSLGARLLEAFPSYPWQILFIPLFGVFGVFILFFLWRELRERRSKALMAIAIAGLALAIGLDFLEGLDDDHPWNVYTRITETYDFEEYTARRFSQTGYRTLDHFARSIEEFLEMLAMTFFWAVFLGYFTVVGSDLRIRFKEAKPE